VSLTCDDLLLAVLRGDELDAQARAHRASCGRCAALAPAMPGVGRALAAGGEVAPPPDLAARVLSAASPLLADHARAARGAAVARAPIPRDALDGRRLAVALLPAVLLFPLLVVADLALLRALHGALGTLLPHGVTTYLVASYAALLAALVCVTFASIPLLVQRQGATVWKERHV